MVLKYSPISEVQLCIPKTREESYGSWNHVFIAVFSGLLDRYIHNTLEGSHKVMCVLFVHTLYVFFSIHYTCLLFCEDSNSNSD